MVWLGGLLTCVLGYLLGSINFGILVCKMLHNKDPRDFGSGGSGMTNVARTFGKKAATLTLLGDVLKGMASVWVGYLLMGLFAPGLDILYYGYLGGIAAIVGHTFPLYFNFKGGKGVATSGGVILAINPLHGLILVTIFLIIFLICRMVSVASMIGISLYPVVTFFWAHFITHRIPVYSTICALIVAGMVVYMHRANIQRIRNGTEYKFTKKK